MRKDLQDGDGNFKTLNYRLGGLKEPGAGDEVVDTMSKIDGVKNVDVDEASRGIAIQFDPALVSEGHLAGTLNSLGHSILSPDMTEALRREGHSETGRDDVSGV